jgi:hypothetical protein
MWEITKVPWDDSEALSLGNGVGYAGSILSAKIYLVLLVSYIILRINKFRKRNGTAEIPVTGEPA